MKLGIAFRGGQGTLYQRWASLIVVTTIAGLLGAAGWLTSGRASAATASRLDIFSGATEGAPVRLGAGIPLEVFFKVGGSEAQVLQGPIGRGAAMLVDTRITQLASLLVFGTVPEPPVAFPSPTVAESVWTGGAPSPQRADASLDPTGDAAAPSGGGGVSATGGRATAEASEGPRGAGHASYTDVGVSPPGHEGLLRIQKIISDSTAAVTADAVTTESVAVAEHVSLLDGTIRIDGLWSTARAVSTGRPGEALAQGSFHMGRVTAMGKEAEITTDGIRIVETSLPLPAREAANGALQEALAQAGVTIRLLPPQKVVKEDGSFAQAQTAGLYVRLAGSPAKSVNSVVGDLSTNLTFGFASAEAAAVRSEITEDGDLSDTDFSDGAFSDPLVAGNASSGQADEAAGSGGLAGPLGVSIPGSSTESGASGGNAGGDSPGAYTSMGDGTQENAGAEARAAPARPDPTTTRTELANQVDPISRSDWWGPGLVMLLVGFAAVLALQALPGLVRPGGRR